MISSPVRLLSAEEQAHLYQQGVRSVLVIPLRSHDRTIDLLRVDHHSEEHRWTREEVDLICSGADQLLYISAHWQKVARKGWVKVSPLNPFFSNQPHLDRLSENNVAEQSC